MSSAITPDVVGYTEILEESPMTEQEQKELIETETVIKSSFQGKMERDLAIGAGLLKIKIQKLYRGVNGGRLWRDYLNTLDDNEIVMINDAYDVVILEDGETIIKKFKSFNKNIVSDFVEKKLSKNNKGESLDLPKDVLDLEQKIEKLILA